MKGSILQRTVGVTACLLTLSAPAGVAAQDEPEEPQAAPWIHLEVLQVEPGRVDEFMAVQRELSARAKEAKTPWRLVSRTDVFGDPYRFLVATPVTRLASFDRAAKAEGALANRLDACLADATSYAVHTLPDIDNPLPPDKEPKLMVLNHVRVAPGREQEYLDLMTSEFFPHFDEQELHYVTGALALGGEGGFLHVFYVDDFAELDKGSPVMRALGPARAAEATAKLSGIVTSSELWVARAMPELSFRPAPEASDGR